MESGPKEGGENWLCEDREEVQGKKRDGAPQIGWKKDLALFNGKIDRLNKSRCGSPSYS